jgi:Protein of unknown function (DUF1207)
MSSVWRPVTLVLALLLCRGERGTAQARIFPRVPSFELPEASPRVYGLVGRLISARRGDSDFGRESEAEVALGENLPVVALRRGSRPITLGFGSQVYGRFSLGDSKSALISNDWVVGINTTAVLNRWALTFEIMHESSHLGDEYSDRFKVERLDWTREVATGWGSYTAGSWRFTGGLSYVLIDQLGLDRPGAALAVDYHGKQAARVLGGTLRPVGGVFFEANAATSWRVSSSAKLGVALWSPDTGREMAISVIAHDGLSTQRQFFRKESRYIGAELRFDL